MISDTYRIVGKSDAGAGESLYLLEVQITRSLLISRTDMQGLFAALSEGNADGGWNEVMQLLQSGFDEAI